MMTPFLLQHLPSKNAAAKNKTTAMASEKGSTELDASFGYSCGHKSQSPSSKN